MIRRALLLIALAAVWLGLLAWAAGVSPGDPLLPHRQMEIGAGQLRPVFGSTTMTSQGLQVSRLGPQAAALQSHPMMPIAAAGRYPLLQYRVRNFPRTLELSLIFRHGNHPNDVVAVSLPSPGDGWNTIDLSRLASWEGPIIELGLSEYATPQLVPPDVAFQPFVIQGMRLQQRSWLGAWTNLRTGWFGYRPWSLRSINALGRDLNAPRVRSLTLVLALGVAASLLLAWLILRWPVRRACRIAAAMALAAWLLLDLVWLAGFTQRHEATRALYAGRSWTQREKLQPDADLIAAAAQVRLFTAGRSLRTRVLVWSDSSYNALRLAWHLRPLNVAPFNAVARAAARWRADSFLVLYGDIGAWHYAPASGILRFHKLHFSADAVIVRDGFRVYRLRGEEGA